MNGGGAGPRAALVFDVDGAADRLPPFPPEILLP